MYNSQLLYYIFKIQSHHLFILIIHDHNYNKSHIDILNEVSMVYIVMVTLLLNHITFLHSLL
jgi:hypothetical protein